MAWRATMTGPTSIRWDNAEFRKLYEDSHVWDAAIVADPDSAPPPSPLPAPCNRDCEYKIRSADGIIRWIRDRRFSIRGASGDGERSAGIAEDITDRKLRELELANLLVRERAARTAAEAVVRAKDEFLGVVSHELRSPLNAIRGWAHVLRQDAINDGVLERAVDAILRNADAQVRVIDDLMDAARIIQGKMSVALRPGSINAVINAAADTQRPMIQAKKLTLTIDLDPATTSTDRSFECFRSR